MSKEYVTGGRMYRCPECGVNWYGESELRSYDPETGEDKLLKSFPAEKHPKNGCPRQNR